jgi:hypothetical protein
MKALVTESMKDRYEEVKIISKEMARPKESYYKHSPYLVMYVTKSVTTQRKVTYVSMPPGRGKSWFTILSPVFTSKTEGSQ